MKNLHLALFRKLGVLFAVVVLSLGVVVAKGPDKNNPGWNQSLLKASGDPQMTILNINNFTSFMRADGQGNHDVTDQSGGRFPRGTSTALYEDGFVWGGKLYTDAAKTQPSSQLVRVGGQTYNQGTRQGAVTGFGAAAVATQPADARARIYRIRRDYAQMTESELRADAATLNLVLEADVTQAEMDAVKEQYDTDWKNWPVDIGAPYIERNGVQGFQPPPAFSATFTVDSLIAGHYDEPGVAGADPNSPADQVVWTVVNDLDVSAAFGLYQSDPIGLEGQITMWGYKRTDALGNLYFRKIKLINKGGVDIGGGARGSFYIDSMFISQWSDPDLGDSGDDLCGSDTTLSLGFCYNGNAIDREYAKFGVPPPAVGYDFLSGPIVPAPGDSAIFDLKRVYDKMNLPMTGFVYFSAGSPISDPPLTGQAGASYESTLKWYRMLRGLRPDASSIPERFYPFPPSDTPGPFTLTGDPVKGAGFIDGQGQDYSLPPGDRRIILSSGPFSMAPGDTQDIVVGTVGGLGSDRLSSISVMKFNDTFVQNTFDALFAVPKAPPAPKVNFTNLDGHVIMEWGSDVASQNAIENATTQPGTYTFEGYNIYQMLAANSTLKDAKRIVTYDLPTDPTVVLDQEFDQASGQILQKPVQFGTNNGITRYFDFTRDYIKDQPRLNNGTAYYITVTAYTVSRSGFLPVSLESQPQILTVTPQANKPGNRYEGSSGDTVTVSQTILPGGSTSDGLVVPIIIDPGKLTGHAYQVTFIDNAGTTEWQLKDVTANTVRLSSQTNQTGDANYTIADGMMVKVIGPPAGVKDWDIPSGARRFTFADADGFAMEGFSGALGLAYIDWLGVSTVTPAQARNVLLKLAPADSANNGAFDASDTTVSYGYRYLRGAGAPAAQPQFAPFILNTGAGYAFQAFAKNVPLAAYNAETGQRLAVGFLENNSTGGLVDGHYWPASNGAVPGGNNTATTGPREWFFVFDVPYSTTENPTLAVDILNSETPMMYFATWNRRNDASFHAGDEFLILANHINTPANVFEFTSPANIVDNTELARTDANNIHVFPNPYYAFNPNEISRTSRFVTFNGLPQRATIRIFNLAGQLVRTLHKDDASQFMNWDLANADNFPVASGIYIVHVEMPDLGTSKILKAAIIQEEEVPNNF